MKNEDMELAVLFADNDKLKDAYKVQDDGYESTNQSLSCIIVLI